MMTSLWPFNSPSFFSTVTPGQLPTYWVLPVNSLNNVVFPQFGLPASAILISIYLSFLLAGKDVPCVSTANNDISCSRFPYSGSTSTVAASFFRTERS